MTDLPVCRLCKQAPVHYVYKLDNLYFCSTASCAMHGHQFDESNWRKLMFVPDKKHGSLDDEAVGYNEAVDDMLRGGE